MQIEMILADLLAWAEKLIDSGTIARAIDALTLCDVQLAEVLKEAIWLIVH